MPKDPTKLIKKYISRTQRICLIEYMKKHPQFAKSKFGPSFRYHDAKKMWQELSDILNSKEGARKDWYQWRKTWSDIKTATKSRVGKEQDCNELFNSILEMYEDKKEDNCLLQDIIIEEPPESKIPLMTPPIEIQENKKDDMVSPTENVQQLSDIENSEHPIPYYFNISSPTTVGDDVASTPVENSNRACTDTVLSLSTIDSSNRSIRKKFPLRQRPRIQRLEDSIAAHHKLISEFQERREIEKQRLRLERDKLEEAKARRVLEERRLDLEERRSSTQLKILQVTKEILATLKEFS